MTRTEARQQPPGLPADRWTAPPPSALSGVRPVQEIRITTFPKIQGMDSGDLKRALRRVFDTQVLNHGDYNLVYGQPSGSGPALVIGYRRQPLELLLCPVDVASAAGQESCGAAPPSAPLASVALTNVATLADTGHGYQVETVTGYRTWFEVSPTPAVPVGAARDHEEGFVVLDQADDSEDFHQFMGHFMDTLDAFYSETPE